MKRMGVGAPNQRLTGKFCLYRPIKARPRAGLSPLDTGGRALATAAATLCKLGPCFARAWRQFDLRDDGWIDRGGPPITEKMVSRNGIDLHHVVFVTAEHKDGIGSFAIIEADVAQSGVRTIAPEDRDGAERRSADLHEITVTAK